MNVTIVNLILIACAISLILLGIIWIRNIRVYNERNRLLDLISAKSRLANQDEWRKLYAAYDTVDYSKMVTRFWRPLKSFWPQELRDLDRD